MEASNVTGPTGGLILGSYNAYKRKATEAPVQQRQQHYTYPVYVKTAVAFAAECFGSLSDLIPSMLEANHLFATKVSPRHGR